MSGAKIYKWAYGYHWDITFESHVGDQTQLVATTADNWVGTNPTLEVTTVRQGLAPLSGWTFAFALADCVR